MHDKLHATGSSPHRFTSASDAAPDASGTASLSPSRERAPSPRQERIAGLPARPGSDTDYTPDNSPRRRQSRSVSPSTPVRNNAMPALSEIATLPSTVFLTRHLGSTARTEKLAQMVTHLNTELGSAWAFAGSVALNIHAAAINGKPLRSFDDVDIQVDNNHYLAFTNRLQAVPRKTQFVPSAAGSAGAHYQFGELRVEFLDAKLGVRPVRIKRDAIAGMSVLSLEALRSYKNDDLDGDNREKANKDLENIEALIATKSKATVASGSASTAADSEQLPIPKKHKHSSDT